MKHILLLVLSAAATLAADANGKWTGTLTVPTPEGIERSGPALLVLKQEGTRLTGTAGPHAGEQMSIDNGKAEDGKLTFEVSTGGGIMKFILRQEGDEIKGDVTRERDGQQQQAKLAVKREK